MRTIIISVISITLCALLGGCAFTQVKYTSKYDQFIEDNHMSYEEFITHIATNIGEF